MPTFPPFYSKPMSVQFLEIIEDKTIDVSEMSNVTSSVKLVIVILAVVFMIRQICVCQFVKKFQFTY